MQGNVLLQNRKRKRHGARPCGIRSSNDWQQKRRKKKRSKLQIRHVPGKAMKAILIRLLMLCNLL